MGCTKFPCQFQLPGVYVHGDDRVCSSEARPLDRSVADSAASEHRHRVTTTHLTRVHRRSQPGHDTAPDEAGSLWPGGGIDLGGLSGSDQRLFGKGTYAQCRRQRLAVKGHLLGGVVCLKAVPGPTTPT